MTLPTMSYYSNNPLISSAFAPLSPHMDASSAAAVVQMRAAAANYNLPGQTAPHTMFHPHQAATYLQQTGYAPYPVAMNTSAGTSGATGMDHGQTGFASVNVNHYQQQLAQQHQQSLQAPVQPASQIPDGSDDSKPKEGGDKGKKGKPDLEYVGALALLGMRKQSVVLPSPPVSNHQTPAASPSSPANQPNSTLVTAPLSPASPIFTQNNGHLTADHHINGNNTMSNPSANFQPPLQHQQQHEVLDNQNFAASIGIYGNFGGQMGQMGMWHENPAGAGPELSGAAANSGYDPYQQSWARQNAVSQAHMAAHLNGGMSMPHSTLNAETESTKDFTASTPHQIQQQQMAQVNQLNPPQTSMSATQQGQQSSQQMGPHNNQQSSGHQHRVPTKRNTNRNRAVVSQELDISNIEFDPTVDETILVGNVVGRRRGVASSHGGGHIFTCDHPECGKVFRRLYNLKSHMCCHVGDRPFVCQECHVTFK